MAAKTGNTKIKLPPLKSSTTKGRSLQYKLNNQGCHSKLPQCRKFVLYCIYLQLLYLLIFIECIYCIYTLYFYIYLI